MNKKQLRQRDICTKFITPSLRRVGRDTQLREEVSFTKRRVMRGKTVTRGKAKRADYILYYKPNVPLAVIEAKDNNCTVGESNILMGDLILVASLLFFSGASALVYQMLWLRTLGWTFGVTVYAASTVWACFMGGLALGSAIGGRIADRMPRPLRWFGAAELLVGATALATPVEFRILQRIWVAAYPSIPHALPALTFGRFLAACAVLIVPTTAMGATLPLCIKAVERGWERLGAHISVLYASNTAGAIVGTLAAGLLLIPNLGIDRTFLTAASMNLVVGLTAIGARFAPARGRRAPVESGQATRSISQRALTLVLVVFAVSGFVSMGLEVVWFRVLALILRPTVYGYAVMLATILFGIAAGSYLIAPLLDRRAPWIAILAVAELTIAITAASSFAPLPRIERLSDQMTPWLSHVVDPWLAYPVAGSVLAILPTALAMGIAFPIGLRLWTMGDSDSMRVGRRVGRFYALNVTGAIAGSLVTGFLLLPFLGSRNSLRLLAAAAAASGILLLFVSEWRRRAVAVVALVGGVTCAIVILTAADPFDRFIRERYPNHELVWKEEGIESTVGVHRTSAGDRIMTVNGNHQAGSDAATTYVHRRIGHLAMAVHSDPRTALVIGLGGGATAGAVSMWDASVDVVELSGSVVRGARFFESINHGVIDRLNVRLRVDDGRNYMMLTPKRYDVVTADVIHPIYAGSGNLYSAEYYSAMRRVLNPGGIAVQWVAGTEAEFKIIARTFLSVFPETTVWGGGSLLLGRVEPLTLRRADFERKAASAATAEALRELNVLTFDQLLAAFDAGPEALRAFVGPGPVLTDDKPLVEYFLSLPRGRDVDTSSLKSDVRRFLRE